jgi:outer membrane receptor protein involved in Fe transport
MNSNVRGGPLFLCVAAICSQIPTYAQAPAGAIRLEVKDPSGVPMEAEGKLERPDRRVIRSFHTDAQGKFDLEGLQYGSYRLEISRAGFATQSSPVEVQSQTPISRTVTMALGQAPESKVDVVATMPLSGVDLLVEQVAAPVQTATREDVEKSGALDLPDFMNRRLHGVHLNEMQGNPFQADLNYRGYTASPLLGTPQGISVYLDGVRQNQPFGDVVGWDLIQNNAISEITMIPGSNPLFGLNTLGGAISVQTKNGVANPGLSGQVTYGSSGRKAVEAEYGGGKATGFNWFLAANAFHESGWRVDSPSDVRQGFARLGWRTGKSDLGLNLAYAYNTLTGNGLQDFRLLANDWKSIYTIPDTTSDRSPSLNFNLRHSFSSALAFSGNVYYRNIRTESVNGDINNDSFHQSVYQPSAAEIAALKAAGYSGYPASGATAANTAFPFWRCIAQGLLKDEPREKCDGLVNTTKSAQNNYGVSGQMTWLKEQFSGHNQLTAGAAYDRGIVDFTQSTQFGYLNANRAITGINSWEDGSTSADGAPVDSRVNLHGLVRNWSLYASDTLSLGKGWNVTLSGRYNRNTIDNEDRIQPGGGPGSLNGNDVFGRLNASIGVTYSPAAALNIYASYAEGSRAPSAIELGCADPDNPCSLPNSIASDPPLKQVVAGTWEVGFRGKPAQNWRWNIGAFRAENRDDILFVASPQSGFGYFKNFAKTRRQGIQADLNGRVGRVSAGLDYTFLDATYQSTETVDGAANSASDTAATGLPGLDGTITIEPGNRIPLVPRHTGKVFADIQVTPKLMFDLSLVATSKSYARGNENNLDTPDGKYYLGPGISPGYAVFNLAGHYDLNRRLELRAQLDNLFDRHYYTGGQLAVTGLTSQGTFIARPYPAYQTGDFPVQTTTFYAPGAPRRIFVELRVKW